MLVRALKPNLKGLQDVTKQFVVWALNTKREYNTDKRSNFYSFDDDDESSPRRFPPRYRPNRSWGNDGTDFGKWRENSWNDRKFYQNRFSREKSFDKLPRRDGKFTFKEELKPYMKDFYKPHPDVVSRSAEEINEFHKKHNISVFGSSKKSCPPPIFDFNELNLSDKTLDLIRHFGYTSPTPVQSMTWPVALSGYNMVGISRTGSGKTLGFVLPAMIHIQNQVPLENGEGPIALIIAPTRELGQQIINVIKPFARSLSLRAVGFFGGSGKEEQLYKFGRGAEICVGTPGRLMDVLNSENINLSRCTYFVLDEADRLLDMGFNPQIEDILYQSREDKQVLMWSATWPKDVWQLAETYLKEYVAVRFGSSKLEANPNITQIIHVCFEREKRALLENILTDIQNSDNKKTLIFAKTKNQVDNLGYYLRSKGFRTSIIHGDKSQLQRDKSMRSFRSGHVDILVGTLVVGRGLDISDIAHVINFDFPNNLEDYIHIIGRTARGDNAGTAHSFFTSSDASCARELIKILESCNQEVTPKLRNFI